MANPHALAVRLLFDENLAESLVDELAVLFPDSAHVLPLGLRGASDRAIWEAAAKGGFVLVTKDEDFHRLSVLRGSPPKVIWVRLGNCTTANVAALLRDRADEIRAFAELAESAFLSLG